MSEVLCEACCEPCGFAGPPFKTGRCAACGAAGWVDDEDVKFVTARVCSCHIDEDGCDAHNEWHLTPMAKMLLDLQAQVTLDAKVRRLRGNEC